MLLGASQLIVNLPGPDTVVNPIVGALGSAIAVTAVEAVDAVLSPAAFTAFTVYW